MIYGLGTDIVEISRIEKAIKNIKFLEKVYTENEIISIGEKGNKVETYAGKFSAKEAIAKAFGTGVRDFNLTDIEILNDNLGKPIVFLKNKLEEKYLNFEINVSISHCKEYATAVAILVKLGE
ncbi:MAG: holo-ACP synthase [Fusobacteriaceae bacterium]